MKMINLPALALIAATTSAFAKEDCKGTVVTAGDKVSVGKCWTTKAEFKELIAGACGEGDTCEAVGAADRSGKMTRVSFAVGPKGMSFKMKPCPNCVEGLKKVLEDEKQ